MKKELKDKYKDSLFHVDRRFLNKGYYHSTASVVAMISDDGWGNAPYCEFHISNCDRTIDLDIDSSSIKDIDNSIFKMQQIIEVAEGMKKALEKVKPYIEDVEALEEEEKKKRKAEKLAEKEKE